MVIEGLNNGTAADRLAFLRQLIISEEKAPERLPQFANNHIHTCYSFSPYSPTAAVYYARQAGLETAGIMDHDSIAGAREFLEAGEIAGVATTVGLECRVKICDEHLNGKKINNPDQCGVVYMALHGVPHGNIELLQKSFAPLREKRNERNVKMVRNINGITSEYGIVLDFERDVVPLSMYAEGGSITERHIIFALCKKIIEAVGKNGTVGFIEEKIGLKLNDKQRAQLTDAANPYFEYDLLGLLKGNFVSRIYVDADEECLTVSQLKELSVKTGALLCYAYLGDVGNSVTGDKRAQKFEDDYLDLLFDVLKSNGVDAVTYMPSRNTPAQIERLQRMCREYDFFEISGEDINSPRQNFICEQLALPQFKHLIDAAWTLIERERK